MITESCKGWVVGRGGRKTGILRTPSRDHTTTTECPQREGWMVIGQGGCRGWGAVGEHTAKLIRKSLLLLTPLPLGMQLIITQGPAAS